MPKRNNLGRRERMGLVVALACVLVLMLDRLVVRPVARHLDDLSARMAGEARELDYQLTVLTEGPAVEQAYRRALERIEVAADVGAASDAVKNHLDELARAAGVEIVRMEHRAPERHASHALYRVDIGRFETTMEGLLAFLDRVWASPGMLRVQRLTLAPGRDDGRVEGSLSISKLMATR